MIECAYLDTSALLAIIFGQKEHKRVFNVLKSLEDIVSSDLIISESFSACCREGVAYKEARNWLDKINIIRPLIDEEIVESILTIDYLRGADLHHLAAAAWMFDNNKSNVYFTTLDHKQSQVAKQLGFNVL